MATYDHKKIEEKWQRTFDESGIFNAKDDHTSKKYYPLIEFPYPSGAGLHVGHPRPYIALDIIARKRRREGFNVLYPIGWDAFGLPTENYAIKTGKDPRLVTKENTDTFRRQIKSLGVSFDWSREINTTDPSYYKWTQWIFLQLFKHGLAYKAKTQINWCPKDKIGLANEEVVDGKCERCGTEVEKREKEQWMLAITKYAKRLYDDLDTVDYIERAKVQQRNWISPSEGALITFKTESKEVGDIKVFTTRPDTIFGATFMAMSPELAVKWKAQGWSSSKEVADYISQTLTERLKAGRKDIEEKTGIYSGVDAINPANNEKIPIWITNYVLGDVGTGAIMAVPAHDERDYDFAKKFDLPIRQVVVPCENDRANPPRDGLDEVIRDTVIVHLRDTKTNKFALLKWHGTLEGITTAIMGGIDAGQSPQEAAMREIEEEAAITGVRIVSKPTWITAARYCASHKNENRRADSHVFLAEIDGIDGQGEISEEEQQKHTLTWVPEDAVLDSLTPDHQKLVWKLLKKEEPIAGSGFLINSGSFNGFSTEDAKKAMAEKVGGTWTTTYKLRDWVFSRQRYWGEPIPMIHCERDGWVPVPEDQLPLELPSIERYEYTDTGDSPLAHLTDWVNTTCPKCGAPAKRETDTMPNWAGSSWYYLRYADPKNDGAFAGKEALEYFTPVDWYNGGMEHTVLHLLYSRFWHKFLFDIGLVPTPEPYRKRTSHGVILAENNEKMSKSKGNVINPDEMVERFGADSLRTYEMFMGPFDQAIAWSTDGLVGARRFLERVSGLSEKVADVPIGEALSVSLNRTIKKVSEDIEQLKMNTAVAALMTFTNELAKEKQVPKTAFDVLLSLLNPFAPHITEELNETLKGTRMLAQMPWPVFDATKLSGETVVIAIQINGKTRAIIQVSHEAEEGEVVELARKEKGIEVRLGGKEPQKTIYVAQKLVNFVIPEEAAAEP